MCPLHPVMRHRCRRALNNGGAEKLGDREHDRGRGGRTEGPGHSPGWSEGSGPGTHALLASAYLELAALEEMFCANYLRILRKCRQQGPQSPSYGFALSFQCSLESSVASNEPKAGRQESTATEAKPREGQLMGPQHQRRLVVPGAQGGTGSPSRHEALSQARERV